MNNGFNSQPERSPSDPSKDRPESNKKDKKPDQRDIDKRKAKVEPLAQLILGEEAITLFEKPKQEDKLKQPANPEASAEPVAEVEMNQAVDTEVAKEIIDARIATVAAEKSAADSPVDAAVARTDQAFLAAARERIAAHDGEPVEQSINQAYQETIAQMPHEAAEVSGPDANVEADIETPADVPDNTLEVTPPVFEPAPVDPIDAARQAAADAHAHETSRADDFWLDVQPSAIVQTQSMEGAVSPSRPSRHEATYQPPEAPARPAAAFLGLGYLLGRRSGRKHAEKQSKPVVQRLQERVRSLQSTITRREAQIRDLSRQNEQRRQAATQRQPEAVPTMPLPTQSSEVSQYVTPAVARQETARSTPPKAETFSRKPPEAAPPMRAEQFDKTQLLQIAEQIKVGGVSVRSMREVGQFDDDSLKRIVHEYLRGNPNVQQLVSQEVTRHDRDRFVKFETLNQTSVAAASAAATAIATQSAASSQPQYGSIPRPVAPPTQAGAVNPSQPNQPTPPAQKVGTAEKVVLSASVVFIILAAVIIAVVLTRQ